jgi:hypothetical protein
MILATRMIFAIMMTECDLRSASRDGLDAVAAAPNSQPQPRKILGTKEAEGLTGAAR